MARSGQRGPQRRTCDCPALWLSGSPSSVQDCPGQEQRDEGEHEGCERIYSHYLSFLRSLQLRAGTWEREERADLCTDKGPCHGAGVQLVNVIGKAVRLGGERQEAQEGI